MNKFSWLERINQVIIDYGLSLGLLLVFVWLIIVASSRLMTAFQAEPSIRTLVEEMIEEVNEINGDSTSTMWRISEANLEINVTSRVRTDGTTGASAVEVSNSLENEQGHKLLVHLVPVSRFQARPTQLGVDSVGRTEGVR